MMKKILVILLLAALALPVNAQRRKPRKTLEKEIAQLQVSLDSLQYIVDSLIERRYIEDSTIVAVLEGLDEDAPEDTVMEAVPDSLMDLWYQSMRIHDYDKSAEYDMNSVHFSTDVPDAVLEARLKAMNSFITLPFNETVKNYMILYSEKMPTRMSRMMGFAEYYFPIFEEVFASYGLPQELKYMAIIESALDPVARSRAGALGMWQFMYKTARAYGLRIDSFVDERLDVEKAADAAARYLRDAYRALGDWPLAISSYNCGAGNVQKAIRRAGSRDFWKVYDYLPRETRGYMPAFVGAMYGFAYHNEYGIQPAEVGMPAVCDTFEIHKNLHFKQINEVVGVPMETLRQFNPQYTHEIVPGTGGTCILNLPYNWSGAFMEVNRDSLYNHQASSLLNEQVIKNISNSGTETRIAYRVRQGDYLGRIATRNHCTVAQLKKWNHLRSDKLRVGQILYIYRRGSAPATAGQASGSSAKAAAASRPASSSKPASTSKPAAGTQSSDNYTVYTVKAGDSFYSIAAHYPGVSAKDIMNYNGMTSSKIRPGMKIKIPVKK